MPIVVAIITTWEILVLLVQIIYYLQRPSEKSRLWFLILLLLLIHYNIACTLLPDANINLPITWQYVYTYATGVSVSVYFIYYIFKAYNLRRLKFVVSYGLLFFVVLPYLLLFSIPYLVTGNFYLFNKLGLVIPSFYAIVVGRSIYLSIKDQYKPSDSNFNLVFFIERAIVISLSFLFWLSLPIITFFYGPNNDTLEHSLTNAGFLIMTISYIRTIIFTARAEYQQLEDLNTYLFQKVEERTQELTFINEQRANTFISLFHEIKTPISRLSNLLDESNLLKGTESKTPKNNLHLFYKTYNFTQREIEITSLICKGYTYKKIAEILHKSPRTIESNVRDLFTKIGITSKLELIQKCIDLK